MFAQADTNTPWKLCAAFEDFRVTHVMILIHGSHQKKSFWIFNIFIYSPSFMACEWCDCINVFLFFRSRIIFFKKSIAVHLFQVPQFVYSDFSPNMTARWWIRPKDSLNPCRSITCDCTKCFSGDQQGAREIKYNLKKKKFFQMKWRTSYWIELIWLALLTVQSRLLRLLNESFAFSPSKTITSNYFSSSNCRWNHFIMAYSLIDKNIKINYFIHTNQLLVNESTLQWMLTIVYIWFFFFCHSCRC